MMSNDDGWFSMDSAPKDRWIIVVSGKNIIGDEDTPYLAKWSDKWQCFINGLGNDTKPTHWRPLPAPPKTPEGVRMCKDN